MPELPSGTVTFLFTDLKGSTRLWEEYPQAMKPALGLHDEILNRAVELTGGRVVKATGDGIHAAFPTAQAAVEAAMSAQLALAEGPWGPMGPLQVRMGLHTGVGEQRDGDYFGSELNRAARIMGAANPGQVLCSQTTADLVRDTLPVGVGLIELGRHALRDLQRPEFLSQLTHPDLPRDFPPLLTVDAYPGNLPRQVTTFVGREQDVETISRLVAERPLVTLTGVGGVGKTRLAVQVAAEVIPEFDDGAWLCELGPVADPDAAWETLASVFGVRPSVGPSFEEAVLEYLQHKRSLLVLDNCEHLLGRVANMVSKIAQRCPRISVLATSREGLAIAGEQIVAVPSLGLPPLDAGDELLIRSESVRLFCDRAHDAKNDFALTDRNKASIAQLCRRLDGIPLAIELAAARVRSLPPEVLVERLDQRFRLLTRGSRAAIERHQTLRNTIDWSYDLLSDAERGALNRLSVFAGGCDLSAGEAILAGGDLEATDLLSQLVDKSLVLVESDGSTRYRLLETIRQYAQERLEASGETEMVRGLHLAYYVALAEDAAPYLRSRDQLARAAALAPDMDNLRAALDYAIEACLPNPALRLVAALAVSGLPIGVTAMGWADAAQSIPGADTDELFPLVVAHAAVNAAIQGDFEHAGRLVASAEQIQAALGTHHLYLYAAEGALALFRGNHDEARHHAELWLEQARATGDPFEISSALLLLEGALVGDPVRGKAVADESVRVARDAGLHSALAYALGTSLSFLEPEEYERELAIYGEIIEVATAIGDDRQVGLVLASRESTKARQGDWRTTLRSAASAVSPYRGGGDIGWVVPTLTTAAIALTKFERFEAAAVVFGFSEAHMIGAKGGNEEYRTYVAAAEAAMLDALGEVHLAELRARGAGLALPDAIDYLCIEADRALAE